METSDGTEEFTSFFRSVSVIYVLPLIVSFIIFYLLGCWYYNYPINVLAYAVAASCGASVGIAKLGYEKSAIRFFFVSTLLMVWAFNMPTTTQSNGFATGSAYLICMYPLFWWVCFAERQTRAAALAICLGILSSIALSGQYPDTAYQVPLAGIVYGFFQAVLFITVTMGMGYAFEISIKRFNDRWKKSYAEQQNLGLELQIQTRDMQREVDAHQSTLMHLTRSENRYRSLFDNGFDGIAIDNGIVGGAIEINEKLQSLLGYSAAEMSSKGLLGISPINQACGRPSAVLLQDIEEKLQAGMHLQYPWRYQSQSGKLIDCEVNSFFLPGEDQLRVSILRDLTVQNQTNQALEVANAELRTFAQAASHDLKEPLRTMSNFAVLLARKYADKLDEDGRLYITFITDAAKRGTALVSDLLRFAEVGSDQLNTEIVNLNTVATSVKQAVSVLLKEQGAMLEIGDLPEVVATPTWAHQLLQNLISNALKFSREGVVPHVVVAGAAVESSYEIYVRDNGIGIAPENLDRIFGVFERLNLREDFEGNGVGLALCQRIMKKLGGSIRVTSTLGEGTTFILSFPMLSPESPSPLQSSNSRSVLAN